MRGNSRKRFGIGVLLSLAIIIGLPFGVYAVQNIFTGFGYVKDIQYGGANIDQVVYQGEVVWERCDLQPRRFNYTGAVQAFAAACGGNYQIELWGASGGRNGAHDGAGRAGYTSGNINLMEGETLYVYIGQEGIAGAYGDVSYGLGGGATFNGGGAGGDAGKIGTVYPYSSYYGGSSGGGATDIRLAGGAWNDPASLRSRIMVAAGGGGNMRDSGYDASKSNAGGLIGQDGGIYDFVLQRPIYNSEIPARGRGGTQTSGGAAGADVYPALATPGKNAAGGQFGIGGRGSDSGGEYCNGFSGGGGGYYGGGGSQSTASDCHSFGGAGGSSFISGHAGSNAIGANGVHTGAANHYSGKVFSGTRMIDGSGYAWTNVKGGLELMPNPNGGSYASGAGHIGSGVVKITFLGSD